MAINVGMLYVFVDHQFLHKMPPETSFQHNVMRFLNGNILCTFASEALTLIFIYTYQLNAVSCLQCYWSCHKHESVLNSDEANKGTRSLIVPSSQLHQISWQSERNRKSAVRCASYALQAVVRNHMLCTFAIPIKRCSSGYLPNSSAVGLFLFHLHRIVDVQWDIRPFSSTKIGELLIIVVDSHSSARKGA